MAATALTLRRTAPKFLAILRPTYFASAGSRSFTRNAGISRFNDSNSDSEDDDERQFPNPRNLVLSRPPPSFSDVFGLNPIDQLFTVNPFLATGPRRGWDVKEDKDGLYLRMDMPGLGKENVKVSVERNTLVIKGEGEGEPEEGERRRYSNRIDLPGEMFKLDRIRAEMKNGLLKVMVPKVKAEERTDVRQVQIQ